MEIYKRKIIHDKFAAICFKEEVKEDVSAKYWLIPNSLKWMQCGVLTDLEVSEFPLNKSVISYLWGNIFSRPRRIWSEKKRETLKLNKKMQRGEPNPFWRH